MEGEVEEQLLTRTTVWNPYIIDNFGYFTEKDPSVGRPRPSTSARVSDCKNGGMRGQSYDHERDRFIFMGSKGCVLIWKLGELKPYRLLDFDLKRGIFTTELSNDGAFLAMGTDNGDVIFIDLENSVILRDFAAEGGDVKNYRLMPVASFGGM